MQLVELKIALSLSPGFVYFGGLLKA